MERIESLTFETDRGTAVADYVGEPGSKVWRWRFADGSVETQPNVTAMMAFKRSVNARAGA